MRTTYSADGIIRERVFCYELYHQIRCLQKESGLTDFNIHGEIDKRGHGLFKKDDRNNPDFIFHVPGVMEENLVIIEAKGELVKNGVSKDWVTLRRFCDEYLYGKGMWLVYNYSLEEIHNFVIKEDIPIPNDEGKIEIICKRQPTVNWNANYYVIYCYLMKVLYTNIWKMIAED